MDDATRARLGTFLAWLELIGHVDNAADLRVLLAAHDALRVERDLAAPVLAAAVEIDSCGPGEVERLAVAYSTFLKAVAAWRAAREG